MAEQMFNDVMNALKDSQNDLERTISGYTSGSSNRIPVDVIEDINEIIVKADLPGFKKEDIKIDISEYNLEISGQFQEEMLIEGANYVKRERRYGEIERVVDLPAKIRIDDAKAGFENGVLKIILPKMDIMEEKESSKIRVD